MNRYVCYTIKKYLQELYNILKLLGTERIFWVRRVFE